MSRESSLVKNTAILSLGTFFPRFLTVFVTPILTAQLTKVEYGRYDLITTIVSFLLPVVTLQVSTAAFRFLIDKRDSKEECKKIISSIFTFVIITSIIACSVYYIAAINSLGTTGIVVSLYFLADILLITTQQIMRGIGKNFLYSISTIIRSIVDVGLIVLLTGIIPGMHNYALSGVLWAMFLSTFIAFGFLLLKGGVLAFLDVKAVSMSQLKELLSYSWPMVPNNLSMWVLRLSDRLVITAALGIEANAVYAAANKLPTIFSAFQSTFMLAWQENASIAVKDGDKDVYYSHMFDWVFSLLTGVMAVLIATTPVVWRLLIRGDYGEGYYQLPMLYIGMLFLCMSSALGGIYVAHMRTKSIGITTMVAASINLLIDLLFVRTIGIWAGSLSTMVAYLFLVVYRMIDIQKFQKVKFNFKKIITSIALLSIMSIINFYKQFMLDIINIGICVVILCIFDRKILARIFKTIASKMRNRR